MSLRELPVSHRFARPTIQEVFKPKYTDLREHAEPYSLKAHQVATLALNEMAAAQGSGFFFHLPDRNTLKQASKTDKALYPPSRERSQPSRDFPAMIYVKHVWTPESIRRFFASPQRHRFLASDALLNSPAADTPIYGVQFAACQNYPVYVTTSNSIVILSAGDELYCATTEEMADEAAIGRPNKYRRATGADPEYKMNSFNYVWDKKNIKTSEDRRSEVISQYKLKDLDALYRKIIEHSNSQMPNLSASEFLQIIPQPRSPEAGTPLGSAQLSLTQAGNKGGSGKQAADSTQHEVEAGKQSNVGTSLSTREKPQKRPANTDAVQGARRRKLGTVDSYKE